MRLCCHAGYTFRETPEYPRRHFHAIIDNNVTNARSTDILDHIHFHLYIFAYRYVIFFSQLRTYRKYSYEINMKLTYYSKMTPSLAFMSFLQLSRILKSDLLLLAISVSALITCRFKESTISARLSCRFVPGFGASALTSSRH